jgi:hypothetical protein
MSATISSIDPIGLECWSFDAWRCTIGEAFDVDPFPMAMINFEEKRVLVWTYQAKSTKGKNVLVLDELKTESGSRHQVS